MRNIICCGAKTVPDTTTMSSRRPTSARPSASKRGSIGSSRASDHGNRHPDDLVYECKAAFLVLFEDVQDSIQSRKQLSDVLQQAGRNPTKKMLNKYWTDDIDSLSFDEFVDICSKEPATSEDELMKAFRKIDLNGDGYVDNSELKKVLTTRGERMSTAEVQAIIDEVDENNDGRLDYHEFSQMLLSTQKECQKLARDHLEKKSGKSGRPTRRSKGRRDDEDDSEATLEDEPQRNGKSHLADTDDDDDDDVVVGTSRSGRSSVSNSLKKDTLGSSASLRSNKADSSAFPPKPRPRTSKRGRDWSPDVRPSPRGKERTKSPIAGKDLKLQKPKRIKDWKLSHSKGCFFFDDDNKIVSHQYEMTLPRDTSVWITIEPFSIRPGGDLNSAREVSRSPVDTMLFILRDDNSLVTLTEQRDLKGRYGVRCDLERGRYKLIPFTTGCRFRPRTSEPSAETKLVKKTDNKCVLTKAFKEALNDIFELCDLDGNGSLSRQEFNFFNLRTSGEEVNNTEWEVVEDKLELKSGEITRPGFIQLNQMEADDNDGDTEELWVTLESMGFSKDLSLDEACPFFMEIYTESCDAKLKVTDLKTGGLALERAVVDATIGKGEANQIRSAKDVFLHTDMNDFRACLVVENKSNRSVKVNVDSSRSDNCTASTPDPEHTISVPARTSTIAQHVMPSKETREWTLRSQESVVR